MKVEGLDLYILESSRVLNTGGSVGDKGNLNDYWGDDISAIQGLKGVDNLVYYEIIEKINRNELKRYCQEVSRRRHILDRHLLKLWKWGMIKLAMGLVHETKGCYNAVFSYRRCWEGCPSLDKRPDCEDFSIACPQCHTKENIKWATDYLVIAKPLALPMGVLC